MELENSSNICKYPWMGWYIYVTISAATVDIRCAIYSLFIAYYKFLTI